MKQLDQHRSQGNEALFKQPLGPGRGSGHTPARTLEKLLNRENCVGKRGQNTQLSGACEWSPQVPPQSLVPGKERQTLSFEVTCSGEEERAFPGGEPPQYPQSHWTKRELWRLPSAGSGASQLQAGARSGLPPVLGNFCSNTFMSSGSRAGLLSGLSSRGELVPLSVLQGLNYLLSGPVSDFSVIIGWILNAP